MREWAGSVRTLTDPVTSFTNRSTAATMPNSTATATSCVCVCVCVYVCVCVLSVWP